jgi:cysteine desulfurase
MHTHPGLTGRPIYLDYNATTPVDPRVIETILPYLLSHFGNPSSGHHYGAAPAQAVAAARAQVGGLVGAAPRRSCSPAAARKPTTWLSAARSSPGEAPPPGPHTSSPSRPSTPPYSPPARPCIACTASRSPTCPSTATAGSTRQHSPTRSPTTPSSCRSCSPNNETGTLQPIAELARTARRRGVLFHTDAAQAVGKIPVDVAALDVDLLTLVGHKMYAPKGIAALYVRSGTRLEPLIHGGGQEYGRRAGTENVAHVVALGAAAELAAADLSAGEPERLRGLRDDLHRRLAEQLPGRVHLNGHADHRLPTTANLALTPHRGDDLLAAAPGIAASTGSACHAGTTTPSPVLTAMALPEERTRSAVRLSVGRWTTPDDIAHAATAVAAARTSLASPQR